MKTTVTHDRETKGTHVYKNPADDAPISTLYISKVAFKGEAPRTLTIDIKEL